MLTISGIARPSVLICLALIGLALAGRHSAYAAAAPQAAAPGGLYVGYYQEDPQTNPEDPTPGAFVLNLPPNDADFNGDMFFTYVGCQRSNVGDVKGTKSGNALSGTWSGTIDGSAQSGPYSGKYNPAAGFYTGVYRTAGGKQFKSIPGCIEYYIAPNGTWEMFPIEQNQPADFKITLSGATASWGATPGALLSLFYVIDAAAARAGNGNPIKFQTVLPGSTTVFELPPSALTTGREYILVTLVNNGQSARAAFASKRFVAP